MGIRDGGRPTYDRGTYRKNQRAFKDNPDFEIVTMRGIGYKVVKNNGTKRKEKRIADPILSDWCNLAGTCIFNSHICFIICFLNHFF